MQSKDDTAALWLHNKLGSASHLWSFSSTVVSQYNLEKLHSIKECFTTLDSVVKFKFFLSLFHIPKRNLEEFKPVINEIIANTIQTCLDQWVLSIATFIQSYWLTQMLDTEADYDLESFKEAYTELTKSFKRCIDSEAGCERAKFLLPIECDYLNKNARLSNLPQNQCLFSEVLAQSLSPSNQANMLMEDHSLLVGNPIPSQSKAHFTIVKHPKSISVIDDLRNKAIQYSKAKSVSKSLMSTSGSSIGNENEIGLLNSGSNTTTSKSFQFVNRLTSKKIESIAALNNSNFNSNDSYNSKIFSNSSNSSLNKSAGSSSFFKHSMMANMSSSTTITGKSSTIKRDIGIKLLDASEQSATPKEAKRKRKEQEKEALKKLKQEQKQLEKEQTTKGAIRDDNSSDNEATAKSDDPTPSSIGGTSAPNAVDTNIPIDMKTENTHMVYKEEHGMSSLPNNAIPHTHPNGSFYSNAAPYAQSSSNVHPHHEPVNLPPSHHIPTPQISSLNDLFPVSHVQSQQHQQQQHPSMVLPTFSLSAPSSAEPSGSGSFMASGYHQQQPQIGLPVNQPDFRHHQSGPPQPQQFYGNGQGLGHGAGGFVPSNSVHMPSVSMNSVESRPQQQQQQSQPQQQAVQQPSLTLTREQMLQAQEMFSNSNKLTRPEKALILGFIAGSRENPRPEQGSVVSIKLNEVEEVLTASNGQQHRVLSELFFQMNYDTGEYKKVKKLKPIAE